MASDFRLLAGFPEHDKTHDMIERLGTGVVYHWLCLLAWSTRNRTSGDFYGMTIEHIERHAKWPDFTVKSGCYKGQRSRGLLVDTFTRVGFLDFDDQGYKWHDWSEHQPWVVNESKRKACAKAAAGKRWDDRTKELMGKHKQLAYAERVKEQCASHETALPSHESRNAPSPVPVPVPTPIPTPEPKAKPLPLSSGQTKRGCRIPDNFAVTNEHRSFARAHGYVDPDAEIETFRDYWTAKHGAGGLKLDWDATFRVWLSKADKYGGRNGTRQQTYAERNEQSVMRALAASIARDADFHQETSQPAGDPVRASDDGRTIDAVRPRPRSLPAAPAGDRVQSAKAGVDS